VLLTVLYILEIVTLLNWYVLRVIASKELADNQLALFKQISVYFRRSENDRSFKVFLEHLAVVTTVSKRLLISLGDVISWWIKRLLFITLLIVSFIAINRKIVKRYRNKVGTLKDPDRIMINHTTYAKVDAKDIAMIELVKELIARGYKVIVATSSAQMQDDLFDIFTSREHSLLSVIVVSSFNFCKVPYGRRLVWLVTRVMYATYLALRLPNVKLLIDTCGDGWSLWPVYNILTDCPVSTYVTSLPFTKDESDLYRDISYADLWRGRIISSIYHRCYRNYYLLLEFFYLWCAEYCTAGMIASSLPLRRHLTRLCWSSNSIGSTLVVHPPISFGSTVESAEIVIKDVMKHKGNTKGTISSDGRYNFLTCTQLDRFEGVDRLCSAYLDIPVSVTKDKNVSLTICILTSSSINKEMSSSIACMISRARQNTINFKIEAKDEKSLTSIFKKLTNVDKEQCIKKDTTYTFMNNQYVGLVNVIINPNFHELGLIYEQNHVYVHLDSNDSYGLAVGRALSCGLEVLTCEEHDLKHGILAPIANPMVSTGRSREIRIKLQELHQQLETKHSVDIEHGGAPAYIISSEDNIETESLTQSLLNIIEMSEGSRLIMRINGILTALGRLGGHNRFGPLMLDAINKNNKNALKIMN